MKGGPLDQEAAALAVPGTSACSRPMGHATAASLVEDNPVFGKTAATLSPQAAPPAPGNQTADALETKLILVVDDILDMQILAGLYLKRAGFAVAFASDGVEALEYLRSHAPPALIVLDLRMPRMDGWEFLEHRAQDAALASIPVVIYSCEYLCSECDYTGQHVFDVVPKPVDARRLVEVVRKATFH